MSARDFHTNDSACRSAPTTFWHRIGQQLRHPAGLAGNLAGLAMGMANRRPNLLAIEALGVRPQDHILELGFGPGHAIKRMANLAPFGKIYGVDQSLVMLKQAHWRNIDTIRSGQVYLKQSDWERLPLPDQSVDKILAVNVVYFWHDPATIMREVRRVLRPGGLMSLYATDESAMRQWKFAGIETHRLFGAEDLASLFRLGGFRREDTEITKCWIGLGVLGLIAKTRKP